MARKSNRSLPLDVLAVALGFGAYLWAGVPGAVIYFVALMVGGIGAIYNGMREGKI